MTTRRAVASDERTSAEAVTVALIVVLAFALRLAWGIAADVTPGGAGYDDSAWYRATAIHLMNGKGYVSPFNGQPTAAWPPGYPATLAVAYRMLGPTTPTTVLVNALAGALTCWLVWQLGRALVGGRAALLAAALLACFPSHVFFAALTLSESVFVFLAMALLLAGVRHLASDASSLTWLVWGIGVGVVTMVRSETLACCVLPAAALLRRGGGWRAARVLAATVLGTLLALTPWTIRNARVFGAFVPTNSGLGRTLWAGHNPVATGGMTEEIQRGIQAAMTSAGVSLSGPAGELAVNRVLVAQAVSFAVTHPLRELALIPARFFHLFRGDHVWEAWYGPGTPRFMPSNLDRRRLSRIGNAYYLVVGILALAGWFVRGRPSMPPWRLFDGFMLLCIATFSLTLGDPRYHHVLIPPACLMAAVALLRLTPGATHEPPMRRTGLSTGRPPCSPSAAAARPSASRSPTSSRWCSRATWRAYATCEPSSPSASASTNSTSDSSPLSPASSTHRSTSTRAPRSRASRRSRSSRTWHASGPSPPSPRQPSFP
jgi:hypothetical protein